MLNSAFIFQMFRSKINFCLPFTREFMAVITFNSALFFLPNLITAFSVYMFPHPSFDTQNKLWIEHQSLFHVTVYANVHQFKRSGHCAEIGYFHPSCLLCMSKDGCGNVSTMKTVIKLGVLC